MHSTTTYTCGSIAYCTWGSFMVSSTSITTGKRPLPEGILMPSMYIHLNLQLVNICISWQYTWSPVTFILSRSLFWLEVFLLRWITPDMTSTSLTCSQSKCTMYTIVCQRVITHNTPCSGISCMVHIGITMKVLSWRRVGQRLLWAKVWSKGQKRWRNPIESNLYYFYILSIVRNTAYHDHIYVMLVEKLVKAI